MFLLKELHNTLAQKECYIFDMDKTIINLNANWDAVKIDLQNLAKEEFDEDIKFSPLWSGCKYASHKYGKDHLQDFYDLLENKENYASKYLAELNSRGIILLKYIHKNFIQSAKKRKWSIVLSNNFQSTIQFALERFKLLSYFDKYYGRDSVPKLKPNPAGLEFILNAINTGESNMTKEEMVFFGDSKWDRNAAERFGIDFYNIYDFNAQELQILTS
ncbi:MAG: HAD hydrolase-like protein [Candidatus Lokiarchaeota archaeon]|nr:HAD hydrolase-like protein [Candidatus Lokiarchaeota archaeon]